MGKHLALASAFVAALSGLAGCSCDDTGAMNARYVCTTDAECAEGFFCDRSGECIKNGGAQGGGIGGGGGAAGAQGGGGGSAGGAGGGDPTEVRRRIRRRRWIRRSRRGRWGGGGGAGSGGGTPDAGFLQLVFTSAPQTIPVGTCSGAVNFEIRNGAVPTGVAGGTVVTFSAAPGNVLGLFRGTGCATAGPLTMAPDASTGTFSYFGGDGGAFTVSLASPGIAGASQSAQVSYPAVAGLAFVTAPQTVRAGDCSGAVTVELRDSANAPTKASTSTAVTLSSAPVPGVTFHSDALCNTAITQATIAVGASRATFYVAANTGQTYTLTAQAGTPSGTRTHTVLPMVRAGTCTIGNADGGTQCPVSPALLSLSDSFLVYQVGNASPTAGAVAVRCDLDSTTNITCHRNQYDQDAVISWQVAEVKGAVVRRVETTCDGGLSVPLGATVPAGGSFVLTANENDGTDINDSDLNVARLNDAGTAVDFFFGGGCLGDQSMSAQVVTLPNLAVTRYFTNIAAGSLTRTIADPPPPTQGVLLAQWTTGAGGPGICDRAIRTELQGNSQVFSRGNGSANGFCSTTSVPSISYERVDFKNTATVQQATVNLAAGAMSGNVTITAVDRTRTLVFTGSHSSMGLGLGEGQHLGNAGGTDFWGDVAGSFTLGGGGYQSTVLTTTRKSAQGASRWSVWVVELIP